MVELFSKPAGITGTVYFCHFHPQLQSLENEAIVLGNRVNYPPEVRHEKRKREWLVLKMLQHEAGIETVDYRENGKPFLTDGRGISISHGESLAAILVAGKNAGLDIQKPDEKLKNIRHKFCNEQELKFCTGADDELDKLTIMWSVKEAVFKFFGEQVHFARDISVKPFEHSYSEIYASYNGRHGARSFSIAHGKLAGHHFAYIYE